MQCIQQFSPVACPFDPCGYVGRAICCIPSMRLLCLFAAAGGGLDPAAGAPAGAGSTNTVMWGSLLQWAVHFSLHCMLLPCPGCTGMRDEAVSP
eukprot:1157456-Pelagomonas_calceolata.AAC.9